MGKKASIGTFHMTAKERNDRMFAGALLLPSVLITVIFILIPVADSVVKSFLSYKVKNIISVLLDSGTILQTTLNCSRMESWEWQWYIRWYL